MEAAASDRVDRNDMAERSRERPCFVGGVLRAVRRRAFVPGAKSGGSPASPSVRSAYHLTASIRSPKRGAVSVMVEPSAAWRLHSNVREVPAAAVRARLGARTHLTKLAAPLPVQHPLRGARGRKGGAWMTPVRPFWQTNITARAAA